MTLTITLVAALAFTTLCASIPLKDKSTDQSEEDYSKLLQDAHSSTYPIFQTPLPLSLELPKEEETPLPFYASEPETFLKAPRESSATYYYKEPIPNQDLVAPIDTLWNPDNDPKFYYEVPTIITKQELPTQKFPKKYNDVHEKNKPISSKPKTEVIFEPVPAKQHDERQTELEKIYEKLAKKENQKLIKMLPPRNKKPSTSSTDPTPISSNQIQSASYDQGLSSQLIDSLGIPTNAATHVELPGGGRLEFHMVGHDGPLSYKWGYDTGKGPNRLFRFEERDKDGEVKGHYGFYGEEGKLQVIHYDAHPHTGFHVSENL